MSYSQLPIEIWREISLVDHRTYYTLVCCCKQFTLDQNYVKSLFIRSYSGSSGRVGALECTVTKLPNGWLHSCNDLPAMIDMFGNKFWYRDNKVHRSNNMPAIMWQGGLSRMVDRWRASACNYGKK
jgi:hypothetical protein